jgi:anti-anti-sigma factor
MNVTARATTSGWTILIPTGRIDAHTAPDFERACHARVQPAARLAIDLAGVDYLSSAGLRALLSTLKLLRQSGGELALVTPQESVQEVLDIAGFTGLIPVLGAAPA